MTRRGLPILALLALTAASSGCFRYVPAQLETTPPGQGVRVMMTRQGADELSVVTRVSDQAPSVQGTVVSVDDDELLLRIAIARRQEGFISSTLDQTVRVPRGEIVSFEQRELDGLATGLLIGGAAAITASVVAFIIKPFGREDPPPGQDPPELLRLGLFSLPIGE